MLYPLYLSTTLLGNPIFEEVWNEASVNSHRNYHQIYWHDSNKNDEYQHQTQAILFRALLRVTLLGKFRTCNTGWHGTRERGILWRSDRQLGAGTVVSHACASPSLRRAEYHLLLTVTSRGTSYYPCSSVRNTSSHMPQGAARQAGPGARVGGRQRS